MSIQKKKVNRVLNTGAGLRNETHKETLQLVNHIRKLYMLLKNKEPKIKIGRVNFEYPEGIARYDLLEEGFIIYEDSFLKALEEEKDKNAAILGTAVQIVTQSHEYEVKYFPWSIDSSLPTITDIEKDATKREEIMNFYEKAKKEGLKEDEILKYITKNLIRQNNKGIRS